MLNKIQWKQNDKTIKQEMNSLDNRWCISQTEGVNDEYSIVLFNGDLMTAPIGIGSDYKECFKSFINNCDEFMKKLITARSEAAEHLAETISTAKQIEENK